MEGVGGGEIKINSFFLNLMAVEGWVGRSENKFLFSADLNCLQRDEKNADNILSNPLSGGNTVDLSF